jgi:hypothetical protein
MVLNREMMFGTIIFLRKASFQGDPSTTRVDPHKDDSPGRHFYEHSSSATSAVP